MDLDAVEVEIRNLAAQFQPLVEGARPGVFDSSFWHGRLLDRAMADTSFKADLFRFIDVLPVLDTPEKVADHLREYLLKGRHDVPIVADLAIKASASGLFAGTASAAVRMGVEQLAGRFIIAPDVEGAVRAFKEEMKNGLAFTADVLGESTLSLVEAERYRAAYESLITSFSSAAAGAVAPRVLSFNHLGPIPLANVSIKISAMDPNLDSADPAGGISRLKKMVLPLLLLAKERNVFVNFDLEQWEYHEITYGLFEEVALAPELKNYPHIGVVVQAYLKESEKDLDRLVAVATRRGTPFTVRLVKGAYWDYETTVAEQRGLPPPVFTVKKATDANYERLSRTLLANVSLLHPAFGTHNRRSFLHAVAAARALGVPADAIEIQMLYGMAEPERDALRKMGFRVRLYAPIGELLPGIGYLVRRLLENSSNNSFIRLAYRGEADSVKLMDKPRAAPEPPFRPLMAKGDAGSPFENSPPADFTDPVARRDFALAMETCRKRLPVRVPVVVCGKSRFGGGTTDRFCPSETKLKVCSVAAPTPDETEEAARAAMEGFKEWRDWDVEKRAALVEKVADALEERRLELAALEAFEAGKPWREADADVGEAIDYCRYYARRALLELSPRALGAIPGEYNLLTYDGRGPTLVISPWNFPVAILCGMAVAALVAGNSVILKPSSKSCATAYEFFRALLSSGLPPAVAQFIPGAGETAGDVLVRHPLVAQIAFTGSSEVGLSIIEKAAKMAPGQAQVKRVVCEMGGKNAVIVDDDADMDAAVAGVMKSAFGYAGQKCSACSRVIVVGEKTYLEFTRRFVDACRSIIMAPAHKPECGLGPVIDEEAFRRLKEIFQNPGAGAEPMYRGEDNPVPDGGYYVPPAVFAVDDVRHPLMQKELFGPVVAVTMRKDFESAVAAALSTDYALTGGVYSRNPRNIVSAGRTFRVGNLYVNRPVTGALVGRQPFGGFGMSGAGTKAGGPGYLTHFCQPRIVSENTMRRGFTPELPA
ncbi:MAG: bifunctional proline dehydrogenase/L-glutamate gamma-semialdehyde dehydrogenase [Nitrospinae bacterium]|nr:bifunctional proline dehydrogenase/L-glutamate gamma-semialdehyde dehydrogenase [Nitrospinota bacterium]